MTHFHLSLGVLTNPFLHDMLSLTHQIFVIIYTFMSNYPVTTKSVTNL